MSDSNLEKILIIDDNSDYRKLISTFISKLLPGTEVLNLIRFLMACPMIAITGQT